MLFSCKGYIVLFILFTGYDVDIAIVVIPVFFYSISFIVIFSYYYYQFHVITLAVVINTII